MDTKLKGDIAEQAAVLQALRCGWGVLKPVGDRLPYDLVFDIEQFDFAHCSSRAESRLEEH